MELNKKAFLKLFFSSASHSAFSDMRAITQETSSKIITAVEPKGRDADSDEDRRSSFMSKSSSNYDIDDFSTWYDNTGKSRNNDDVIVVEEMNFSRRPTGASLVSNDNKNKGSKSKPPADFGVEAQNMFGDAKAISSDQYFKNSSNEDSVMFNID